MNLSDWAAAVWSAFHVRAIRPSTRDVLLTLRTFRGREGRIFPSHATLAAKAGYCLRTVQSGLSEGRDAGLVAWDSGRWRRRVNRYWLAMPREVAPPRQPRRVERTVRALVGKWRGGGEQRAFQAHNIGVVLPGPAEAQAALRAIRERRQAERDAACRQGRVAHAWTPRIVVPCPR